MTAEEKRLRALLAETAETLGQFPSRVWCPETDERGPIAVDVLPLYEKIVEALERSEASKRGKSNRSRGHDTEVMVANYLRDEHEFADAATTRKVLGHDGSRQPGDVTFTPGVVLSVKHVKTPAWPAWLRQVQEEAREAGTFIPGTFSPRIPAVVHRKVGVADVGEWPTAVPEPYWDDLVQDRCDQKIGDIGRLLDMFPSMPVIANRGVLVMRFRTFAEAFRLDT